MRFGVRDAIRSAVKRTPLWRPIIDRRQRRARDAEVSSLHDLRAHREQVVWSQQRERTGSVEAIHGYGTDPAELRAFFASFSIVDPGHRLVRLGSAADGGYLVPDDLEGIAACFSPGVAGEISFDLALAERGIAVHLIDRSVTGLPQAHPLLDFEPLFLGTKDEEGWTTLERWVSRRAPGHDDLMLEMDIEGAEWSVLLSTSAHILRRFRIITIELHDVHRLMHRSSFLVIKATFERLLADFDLVHVHANNHEYPVAYAGFLLHPVVEVTLLRHDRVRDARPRTESQHVLDEANTNELLDYPLDPAWITAAGPTS